MKSHAATAETRCAPAMNAAMSMGEHDDVEEGVTRPVKTEK
jgi:hypothetical protein